MSAAEIIEQIKALPAREREEVAAFIRSVADTDQMAESAGICYADPERVKTVADGIFGENAELFRKLAE